MALDLSNIKNITTKSGVTIKKVIRKSDGKVLWKASEPYVAVLNAPAWNFSTPNAYTGAHTYEYHATASEVYLFVQKGEELIEFGQGYYTATFDTKGCNKVRIKAETLNPIGADCTINGTPITENKYYYFDCSGDNYTIQLGINTGAVEWSGASVAITEIYFYDE